MESGDLGILAIWTICLLASLGVSALTGGRWSRRARAAPLKPAAETELPPAEAVPAGPLVLSGFRHGEDVVSLPVAADRSALITVRPSDDGCDGLVTIGDEVLAIVPGVPQLSAADLRVLAT